MEFSTAICLQRADLRIAGRPDYSMIMNNCLISRLLRGCQTHARLTHLAKQLRLHLLLLRKDFRQAMLIVRIFGSDE